MTNDDRGDTHKEQQRDPTGVKKKKEGPSVKRVIGEKGVRRERGKRGPVKRGGGGAVERRAVCVERRGMDV